MIARISGACLTARVDPAPDGVHVNGNARLEWSRRLNDADHAIGTLIAIISEQPKSYQPMWPKWPQRSRRLVAAPLAPNFEMHSNRGVYFLPFT